MQALLNEIITNNFVGMPRAQVQLSPHNDDWLKFGQSLVDQLSLLFSHLNMSWHHIGSTSIPAIHAKPIIDILGVTQDLSQYECDEHKLITLGFTCKGEYLIPSRRYCVLYNKEQTKSYIHLHVYEKNNPEVERHLLFSEYLKSNNQHALDYNNLKLDLFKKYANKREAYTKNKSEFIERIIAIAKSNE